VTSKAIRTGAAALDERRRSSLGAVPQRQRRAITLPIGVIAGGACGILIAVSDFYCEHVLSGRCAVDVVHEDDRVLAFHHTRPCFTDAHIVVVPKFHISSLLDPKADPLLDDLFVVIRSVAAAVLAQHGAARVLTNLGDYQDSKHLHWHVYAGAEIPDPIERPPGPDSRYIETLP